MKKAQTPLQAGVTSGIIAGVIFGAMMGLMGMLPMVAMLFNNESEVAGFIVHIVFSAIIGVIFAYLFGKYIQHNINGIVYGLLYGFIWWIVGPLVIMPVWLGAGVQLFSSQGLAMAVPSLWGHLLFGFILGLIYDMVVMKEN